MFGLVCTVVHCGTGCDGWDGWATGWGWWAVGCGVVVAAVGSFMWVGTLLYVLKYKHSTVV